MNITAADALKYSEASALLCKKEIQRKHKTLMEIIEDNIKETASKGWRKITIGLKFYLDKIDLPMPDFSGNYVIEELRESGFHAEWSQCAPLVILIRW